MNPFYDAYETSLGNLDNHQWQVLRSTWAHGEDQWIYKVGRKWALIAAFGMPLFRTKREAHDAGTALILAESRWRRRQEWERNNDAST